MLFGVGIFNLHNLSLSPITNLFLSLTEVQLYNERGTQIVKSPHPNHQ